MYQCLMRTFCYSMIKPLHNSCLKNVWVNNVENECTTLCCFILYVLVIGLKGFYTKRYD